MKVTYPRTIVIHEDGQKPVRFTDPGKAAEHWARIKEEEWVVKMKDHPKYKKVGVYRTSTCYGLYDDGRVRYRKLKRRALAIFRKILEVK